MWSIACELIRLMAKKLEEEHVESKVMDTVPVIRCKECKYYTGKWCTKYSTKQSDINDICMADNDFCSRAERKENINSNE